MVKGRVVSVRELQDSCLLDKFDKIRGDIPVSKAIQECLLWFINYDINYLRVNILKLPPLTDQELDEIKNMIPNQPSTQGIVEVNTSEESVNTISDQEVTTIVPLST